jgi:hypothetical protein
MDTSAPIPLPDQPHAHGSTLNVLTHTHAHEFTNVTHTHTHNHTHTHTQPHTTTHNHQDKHYRQAAAPTDALHTIPRPPPHRRTLPRSGRLRQDSPQPLLVDRLKSLTQVLGGGCGIQVGEGVRLLCACTGTNVVTLMPISYIDANDFSLM